MLPIKRPAAALGAAALLALSLTACGGDEGSDASEDATTSADASESAANGPTEEASDAPADASTEEFCDAVNALSENTSGAMPTEEEWKDFQGRVENLADVGTPEGISADARAGYHLFVDAIAELDYSDVENAGENFLQEEFSGPGEQEQLMAFLTYAGTECTELPSSVPTEVPSDLQSE